MVLDTWMLCSINHMDMFWIEVCDLSSSLWSASVWANMRHDCPEMEPVCPEIKYHGLCRLWANPGSVHRIKDTWYWSYITRELVPWWHSFQGTSFFVWRLGNNGRKGEDLCSQGPLWISWIYSEFNCLEKGDGVGWFFWIFRTGENEQDRVSSILF
jgi:hypothetical protein